MFWIDRVSPALTLFRTRDGLAFFMGILSSYQAFELLDRTLDRVWSGVKPPWSPVCLRSLARSSIDSYLDGVLETDGFCTSKSGSRFRFLKLITDLICDLIDLTQRIQLSFLGN